MGRALLAAEHNDLGGSLDIEVHGYGSKLRSLETTRPESQQFCANQRFKRATNTARTSLGLNLNFHQNLELETSRNLFLLCRTAYYSCFVLL